MRQVYESAEAMKGPYPQWDKDMHFVTSQDFFKSAHSKLVSCGNQFEIIGRKVCFTSHCFTPYLFPLVLSRDCMSSHHLTHFGHEP